MNIFKKAIFGALTIVALGSSQAFAVVYHSYTINSGNPLVSGTTYTFGAEYSKDKKTDANNIFEDTYSFTLGTLADASASVVNVTSGAGQNIAGLDFKLYDSLSALIEDCTAGTPCAIAGLSAGNYLLKVFGTVSGNGRGKYDGTLEITAVPLPPAAILFGSVLFGLAVVGRRRLAGGAQAV